MSQKTTSEKGVLEQERILERCYVKQQEFAATILRALSLWKKALTDEMLQRVRFDQLTLLHRSALREAERREQRRVHEQDEAFRRTMEGDDLAKKARLQMKIAAIERERQQDPVNNEQFIFGAWDRALIKSGTSPVGQLQLRDVASVGSSVCGSSPLPRHLSSSTSHSHSPRIATSATAAANSAAGAAAGTSSQGNKRITRSADGYDSDEIDAGSPKRRALTFTTSAASTPTTCASAVSTPRPTSEPSSN